MALGPLQDEFKAHAAREAELIAFRQHALDMGMKTGDDATVAGVIKNAAAAAKSQQGDAQEQSERKAKEQYDDALFLALLNNGDLDNYVAENIFGGMSDVEIADVVSAIEAETGLSFEDYAENILGDDMPERTSGESDTDYHRRILTAVADEILEDDLSIKAGYENDPLARFVNNHEFTQYARDLTQEADEIARLDGAAAGIAHVADEVEQNYAVARTVSTESQVEEVSEFGGIGQDAHRDDVSMNTDRIEGTASFFSGFSGPDGALEAAKADFENQFPKAAKPKNSELASTAEHIVNVEIGRELT